MGVRGLHGFVASSCPHVCTVVNFKELAERHRSQHPGGTPTVVVDAMCCLRYWYTPESWICGGQWREYYSSLREFVRTFTAVGIKLIFFFDGMVEQSKRDEWVKRRLKNNREIAKIFHYIKSHREQPGRNMFFIPSGLAIFTRFALKALGQETLCSLQEADYEVASYGFQNNCLGILGEDTDYLIYDTCPYFSISELSLDSLDTVMLCREKLCQSLGLSLADLPLLACLLGNDVVPEGMFESFRYKCLTSYTSVKENCDRRGNIILAVADHISKVLRLHQGEKKLEEMLPLGPNKALFYKGVTSYLLPGQKSPWFIQKPKDVVTLDKQILSMSSDPESKQEVPMCMDPESKQKLPVGTDPEFNLEAPMCTNTEVKHEDPVNTGPEAKHQVTMVTDPEILKVARAQHVQAESYLVYGVMSSGEVECSNSLEDATDQALPSQAFVYRPVRQRVYSLLLGGGAGSARVRVCVEGRGHSAGPARGCLPVSTKCWFTLGPSCVLVASGVGLGFWLRAQQCLVHCPGQLTEEGCQVFESYQPGPPCSLLRTAATWNQAHVAADMPSRVPTGRWGRPGSSSHGTSSGCSRAGHRQHWRDQGPGSRQYEPDQWRRY
ncbi:constitutive coactivator of peroxisome proliferator-activated receptor gamma [Cervus canadensis]|uniref:constitutive coactivator of peroxisome proliferator-activated receptor gamma n=1 Tax=Cervus canadensis TaxID=1574408 RepID=UPI001CA36929|nr:constitutive coactivator of peroxisome proliferator-activated receptor gamma [Cervus canadensis]